MSDLNLYLLVFIFDPNDIGSLKLMNLALVDHVKLGSSDPRLGSVVVIQLLGSHEVGGSAVRLSIHVLRFNGRDKSKVSRDLILVRLVGKLNGRLRVKTLLSHMASVARDIFVLGAVGIVEHRSYINNY